MPKKSTRTSPVVVAPPITEAHAARLLDAFIATVPDYTYRVTDLEKTPQLQAILDLDDTDMQVLVTVAASRLRSIRKRHDEYVQANPAATPKVWMKEHGQTQSLLLSKVLLRRINLTAEQLAVLVRSAVGGDYTYCLYESGVVAAIERYPASQPITPDLDAAITEFLSQLRKGQSRTGAQSSARIAKALAARSGATDAPVVARELSKIESVLLSRDSASEPASPVMDALGAALVMPPPDSDELARFGAPGAPMDFTSAPELIEAINKHLAQATNRYEHNPKVKPFPILTKLGAPGIATAAACLSVLGSQITKVYNSGPAGERRRNGFQTLLALTLAALDELASIDPRSLTDICLALCRLRLPEYVYMQWSLPEAKIATLAAPIKGQLPDEALVALIRFRERVARAEYPGDRASVRHFDETLGIAPDFPIELGERWSDRAFQDLLALAPAHRATWLELLALASSASGSTPTAKWLKSVDGALATLPRDQIETLLGAWLPLVGKPRPLIPGGKIPGRESSIPSDSSADTLRGLAFLASRFDTPAMARALGDLAMACFKMVPGHGARCIKPGSSALWSLAQMTTPSALAQLSRLRQLVKFGTAKKMLDTSLENLAAKLGITTEELHEIAAPDFGLSSESTITEDAGDLTLELIADPQGAHIRVLDETGKERKTVPDAVKKDHADTLKALKQAKDDIDKMLEAQRARIDTLFIADRTWAVPAWRERYIDHPLVGVLGRRLIWRIIDDPKAATPGAGVPILYRPDTKFFADIDGKPITPGAAQHIKLWHPIFASSEEVRRWRDLIESSAIRQPVKQAHREVYPLTDAERATATYSNRFAAHIIKQHAFQQLAADRSWTSKLRLMVDAEYPPPTRVLPSWALRAEFWIESIGDNYGTDTTESGSFLYLTTDQVRFYRTGAAQSSAHAGGGGYSTYAPETPENQPLRLDQIPPLVFSEIMRDVDLFVAGASVGNNADWQDGGPDGRFRTYWDTYSFGALGASGAVRREFLEKLVPRLKIAPLCSFEDKFLVVKGTLRTYKIHLGSGNILMKPNDQYLCIVPTSSFHSNDGPGGVFLPFDGDRTLSIILSKAFMLAEDAKIKDASITAQIKRA